MEKSLIKRSKTRKSRAYRVRKNLKGSSEKPRLSISKTNRHIYAQIIDDETGKSFFGVGTMSKSLKGTKFNKKSREAAEHIGALIAKAAKEKQIKNIIFDRGRFKYHGIVSQLAEAARKEGLKF